MQPEDRLPEKDSKALDYMEELSVAYQRAFAERLAKSRCPLSEEKRVLMIKMQREVSRNAGKLALIHSDESKKELARMIKESAEETLRALSCDEEEVFAADPEKQPTPSDLCCRAVLLCNRCLNLTVRHCACDQKLFCLISSELSALYALAAIN